MRYVVLLDYRIVLAGLAAEKAPEAVEPQTVGPAIERPGRPAVIGVRCHLPNPAVV